MLWFFTKGDQQLRIHTSLEKPSGDYVVEIDWPGGGAETHRFADEAECSKFLTWLQRELDEQHWDPQGVRLTSTIKH